MNDIAILDVSVIAEAKANMKAKFPTLLQYFWEDSDEYMKLIKNAIDEINSEKIVSPAHTLKSSSRQMGAMRLSNLAKTMEETAREQVNAKQNDMAPFTELFAKMENALAETKIAYQEHAA